MIKSNNSYRGYLLIILIALFFVAALSVFLLLIQGKKLTPTGQIVETGVVRLLSDVGDIKVFLNGKEVSRSNNLIQNVPIGKNTILVQKPGYSDWEKVIKVDNSRVLEITARLYPDEFNIEQVSGLNINTFAYSQDLSNMYFTVTSGNEDENGIWRINLSNGLFDFNNNGAAPQRVFSFNTELTSIFNSNLHNLKISPNGNGVLLATSNNLNYVWLSSSPDQLLDLNVDLGFVPNQIDWFENDSVLVFNNDILFERKINAEANNLVSYQPGSNIVYCTSLGFGYWINGATQNLYRYQNGNSVLVPLFTDAKGLELIKSINCLNNINEVVVEDNSGLYFLDFNSDYIDKIAKDVTITDISADGNTIIYKDVATWYSYTIKDVNGTNIPVTESHLLESVPFNNSVYVVDQGNTLAIFDRNVNDRNLLLLSDIDGENVNGVLEDITLGMGKVAMMQSDRKKLFVVIDDKIEDGSIESMLYVVDLTK
ncbi:PEGA domain-containing protein [Candidatus Dojkabacteria bacterium]|uniref:PEGA domain-containing protein n=1 Tax=Candidatus Dojkabacteria bacterium TaxID=2099670 RepID=A0A955I8H0_9BACT|nr:PEGA domain-containing protein [Candidatus Dojkabacteria bacterium]